MKCMSVGVIFSVVFSWIPFVPHASSNNLVAILGTENGYDRGGPDPVCWTSQFVYNETISTTSSTPTELNKVLWDTLAQNRETMDLLAKCDASTSLSVVVPMLQDDDNTVYINYQYDFDISLNVSATMNTTSAFVRLQFCDALQYGFCNPIPQIIANAQSDVDITTGTEERVYVTKWKTIVVGDPSTAMLSIEMPDTIQRGVYFVIAHAIIAIEDDLDLISRLDIAKPIPGYTLQVLRPPILQEVTDPIKIVLGAAIGVCGAYALALMIFIIAQRKHAVMRLAQGSFLVAICAGCFMQIVSSFVLLPTRDVYCRLVGVLCLVPMTFVASCMVGRIWRVYQTLSNANRFGRNQRNKRSMLSSTGDSVVYALTSIANFTALTPSKQGRDSVVSRRSSVRQSISAKQTVGLVMFLTLPQLLLQLLVASLKDRDLVLTTDITGSFQKRVCEERYMWATMVGTGYVVFVCILAVGLAWIARDLPSAFNEKDQVYRAASVSILTTFIGITLSGILNEPTTNPNLSVILHASWSLIVPMSVLVVIVFPKARRVMSGEKVVMSNILLGRYSIHQPMHEASWHQDNIRGRTADDTETTAHCIQKPPHVSTESRKISLQKDDPLPTEVEGLLFDVQGVLREVTQKITEGRAPSQQDMARLGEEVGLLCDELLLIDFVNTLQSDSDGTVSRSGKTLERTVEQDESVNNPHR